MPRKTREERKAYWSEYRERNRDQIKARRKTHHEQNREKDNARNRRYYKEHREQIVVVKKKYDYINRDKLAAYKRGLIEKKAGRPRPTCCEIPGCGSTYRISLDHDHITGKFRGWTCGNRNTALGYARDNPELLEVLAVYVRTHRYV